MDFGQPTNKNVNRIKPKLGKNVFSCAALAVLFLFILLIGLLFAIAKTGLIKLPLFSRLYIGPIPTRLVQAEPLTADQFRVLLGARFFSENLKHKTPPYTVSFSEKELTGAIMTTIDLALRDAEWKQVFTQIVIRPSDFELLSKFERGFVNLDLIVRLKPSLHEGKIEFDPVYFQIGDYKLQPTFAYRAASYIFSRDLGTWEIVFGEVKLQAMRLFDGSAEVDSDVSPAKP